MLLRLVPSIDGLNQYMQEGNKSKIKSPVNNVTVINFRCILK